MRYLCDCCLVHLESCNTTAVPAAWDWEEDAVQTVECPVCLEEYRRNELQQHREMCTPRLVFRCSLCDEDYLSEESLWNHLIEHKVAHEKRGLFYQTKRVTYKQYTCVLCNDQRSYRQFSYWEHVHEDHDGFYLQCAECGETFRSKKRKTDHDLNHCKSSEQTIPFKSDGLEMEDGFANNNDNHSLQQKQNEVLTDEQTIPFESDGLKMEDGCANNNDNHALQQTQNEVLTDVQNRSSEPSDLKCPHCNKQTRSSKALARHIVFGHEPATCDICGLSFDTGNQALTHKRKEHQDQQKRYPCPVCVSLEFRSEYSLDRHVRGIHLRHIIPAGSSGSDKQEPPRKSKMVGNVKTDCPICQENFSDQDQVSQHVEEVHQMIMCTTCRVIFANSNEQNHHECSLCPHCGRGGYNRKRLITHIEMCHEKVRCDVCEVDFFGKDKLWYHKQKAHSEPQIKCVRCSRKFHRPHKYRDHLPFCRRFNSISYITSHAREAPGVTKPEENLPEFEDREAPSVTKPEENVAEFEDILDVKEISLLTSEDRMSGGQSERNVIIENDDSDKDLIRTNNSKSSQVSKIKRKIQPIKIQNDSTSSVKKFEEKRSNHRRPSIGRVFPCKLCGYKFKYIACLSKHIKQMHSVNKTQTNTHEHLQQLEIQVLDDDVGKSIPQPVAANPSQSIKMEISVEETQLQKQEIQILKDGGRKFSLKRSVVRKPRKPSSSKKCPQCDKTIKQSSLSRHINDIHTPRICTDCGISFEGKRKLAYHMTICHSDPKYKCPYCPEAYYDKRCLERHVNKHQQKNSGLKKHN